MECGARHQTPDGLGQPGEFGLLFADVPVEHEQLVRDPPQFPGFTFCQLTVRKALVNQPAKVIFASFYTIAEGAVDGHGVTCG